MIQQDHSIIQVPLRTLGPVSPSLNTATPTIMSQQSQSEAATSNRIKYNVELLVINLLDQKQ